MKFYDCSTAPSPRRVRIFIAEKVLNIPTVQVDLRNGEQLSPEFRKINPYCTVPVLELDDGTRLTNTQGCWRYLEEMYPDPPLMGSNPKEKALIADLEWRMETEGFMAMADALRNSLPGFKDRALTGPHNYAQIPELAERGKLRTQHFFHRLNELLENRRFLAGNNFSVADITALCTVDFAGWLKIVLPEKAHNAKRWHEEVSSRASVSQHRQ